MKTLQTFIIENADRDVRGHFAAEQALKKAIIEKGQPHQVGRFINDPSAIVRLEIAKRGFKEHLDKLVDDPSSEIRKIVAQGGHRDHLDKLVNDLSPAVRRSVAEKGYKPHLDKLVNDPSWLVRIAVSNNSPYKKHILKLAKDKDCDVASAAQERLESETFYENYSVVQEKSHLEENYSVPFPGGSATRELKLAIIEKGQKRHLDKLVNDPDPYIRSAIAERGFKDHHDILINDPVWLVRDTVARTSKDRGHLDKLVRDTDPGVFVTAYERLNNLLSKGDLE